jgi:hypothetical protein
MDSLFIGSFRKRTKPGKFDSTTIKYVPHEIGSLSPVRTIHPDEPAVGAANSSVEQQSDRDFTRRTAADHRGNAQAAESQICSA